MLILKQHLLIALNYAVLIKTSDNYFDSKNRKNIVTNIQRHVSYQTEILYTLNNEK